MNKKKEAINEFILKIELLVAMNSEYTMSREVYECRKIAAVRDLFKRL